ncbi:DUF2269 domain-containing protein [Streptomyces narbonensis]|uniref:DUF2269 domain-containing protein n=1 Tax=Streptomyces narbonensis TaxID=67333 RepID=UPI003403B0D1
MTRTASTKHPGPRTPPAAGRVRRLPPPWRKAVLTLHVTVAVGWAGVEIAQLLLGLIGLFTDDAAVARATHVVMEILGIELVSGIAWMTLLTGLLLATATQWGLLKHYWIVTKLVLTVALMLDGHFLLQHWLREQAEAGGASGSLGLRLVVSMSVALVLLVAATALSVYKPWGRTRRGRRPAARSARP